MGLTPKQIDERIAELKTEIIDYKAEMEKQEPTIQDVQVFIEENHPMKAQQRAIELQMRDAQNEMSDLEDLKVK